MLARERDTCGYSGQNRCGRAGEEVHAQSAKCTGAACWGGTSSRPWPATWPLSPTSRIAAQNAAGGSRRRPAARGALPAACGPRACAGRRTRSPPRRRPDAFATDLPLRSMMSALAHARGAAKFENVKRFEREHLIAARRQQLLPGAGSPPRCKRLRPRHAWRPPRSSPSRIAWLMVLDGAARWWRAAFRAAGRAPPAPR